VGSFEEAAAEEEAVADLGALVEPLFADCKRDDELATRQCASIRDWSIERAHEKTFWAVSDASAIEWAPFDSSEKKLELQINGCLACGKPLILDGKPRFVSTRVPKAIKGGHAVGLDVGFLGVAQPDEKAAAEFKKKYQNRLRVQFVFKLGSMWSSGGDKGFQGVSFQPIAYRVFDRCTGKVFASEPPTSDEKGAVAASQIARDATCPVELTDEQQRAKEWAERPEQLSPRQINVTLSPVKDRVHDCYSEFQVAGTASVKMMVDQEGKIETLDLASPWDKTPTGYCIRTALKGVTFPRFKGEKMTISYPFQVE
jgi:hypothetical protein